MCEVLFVKLIPSQQLLESELVHAAKKPFPTDEYVTPSRACGNCRMARHYIDLKRDSC